MDSVMEDERDHDHAFWSWLITGNPDGDISKFISLGTSSEEACKNNKVIFKWLAATHAINYFKDDLIHEIVLPDGRTKNKAIFETKEQLGVNVRNTKVFGSDRAIITMHRHWGMNITIGGVGNESFGVLDGEMKSDGTNGHLYLYYMSPSVDRLGGIMIGVEGSEYGKMAQSGESHTLTAYSSLLSVTMGYKWNKLVEMGCNGVGKGIPDKYDSMFIDLSEGWRHILLRQWKDKLITKPFTFYSWHNHHQSF
jgi:hypothetical protein